jgi:hypothetical protein
VHKSVGLQVLRVAKKAHEEVFGGNVEVEACTDNETNKTNAKCNHLDRFTSALYRTFVR